jgi:hypothetical protein
MKQLLPILMLCVATPAWSQQPCAPSHIDVPKDKRTASASSSANLVKSDKSIAVQVSRLLREAQEQRPKVKPPDRKVCSSACPVVGESALVTLSVIPTTFLEKYADADKCERMLKRTSTQPFKFGPHRARSEKELTAWLTDVSRGRGRDGKTLYAKCDGKCSPRYFMDVARDGDGFVANLEVVCGPARDKTDNTYDISSGYRWACQGKRLSASRP